MSKVQELAVAAENEFAFLEKYGLRLVEWSEIAPESFKGGFKLTFQADSGKKVVIRYTDNEFVVKVDNREIFGPELHEPFSGNMFSREHLIDALPRIRASVEAQLRTFAQAAT